MPARRLILGTWVTFMSITLLAGCLQPQQVLQTVQTVASGGGGGSWTEIVNDGKKGLTSLASATSDVLNAQAELADALGLKQDAALLRKEAKNLTEKGEDIGGADIDTAGKNSATVQKKINDKLMASGELDARTSNAVRSAGERMIPALVKVAEGVLILVRVSTSITSAGIPSLRDFAALEVAVTIPALLPKAAMAVPELFATANDFRKIAAEKDIAMPEVPAVPSFS
ncbi:MAG: hypothetical protein CMF71_09515 [Magnetovibrio sp.]|mgnify:CR=1 FL=1|nr:hypothetical protein [Magnetovibrio sp.]|tara:strand:- start:85 stop:768 length:684 start_codon:yes stop_codon:yes gene_type:complete